MKTINIVEVIVALILVVLWATWGTSESALVRIIISACSGWLLGATIPRLIIE